MRLLFGFAGLIVGYIAFTIAVVISFSVTSDTMSSNLDQVETGLGVVTFAGIVAMICGTGIYAFIVRQTGRVREAADYIAAVILTALILFETWSGWTTTQMGQIMPASPEENFGNGFTVHLFALPAALMMIKLLIPKIERINQKASTSSNAALSAPLKCRSACNFDPLRWVICI